MGYWYSGLVGLIVGTILAATSEKRHGVAASGLGLGFWVRYGVDLAVVVLTAIATITAAASIFGL